MNMKKILKLKLLSVIILVLSSNYVFAEQDKQTKYSCEDQGCDIQVLSFSRNVIVHQNAVSVVTVKYLDDSIVEIMFILEGKRKYVTTSLANASIQIKNGVLQ